MKRLFPRPGVWLSLVLLVASPPLAARADVGSETQAVLRDRLLQRANVGVQILQLGNTAKDTREVYALAADGPLLPASNLKLVTTSAALDRFGPDFKFRTLLVKRENDLVLVGDGDPTFGDAEYLKRVGWRTTTVYESWAQQLRKLGVTAVGDVVVDDSVFDDVFFHPHWPANQADFKYMAEVGGVNLNANLLDLLVQPGAAAGERVGVALEPDTRYASVQSSCVTGTQNAVGIGREAGTNHLTLRGQTPARGTARVSVTIHDPPLYAATVLAETLQAAGVKVTGGVRRDRTVRRQRAKDAKDGGAAAGRWALVGVHETPLPAVLGRANKDSVNLYAESLCKRLGFDATQQSGTWESGTAALGAFLQKIGVAATDYHLDDGCGLSHQNAIAPRALARVLAYNYHGPNRQVFTDSLSVAGVDGTLEDRFRNSDLRRRVFGKSGFIDGVSTLSGYLHAKDGQWYAFSVMCNGIPPKSNGEVKLLQERIIRALDAQAAGGAGQR